MTNVTHSAQCVSVHIMRKNGPLKGFQRFWRYKKRSQSARTHSKILMFLLEWFSRQLRRFLILLQKLYNIFALKCWPQKDNQLTIFNGWDTGKVHRNKCGGKNWKWSAYWNVNSSELKRSACSAKFVSQYPRWNSLGAWKRCAQWLNSAMLTLGNRSNRNASCPGGPGASRGRWCLFRDVEQTISLARGQRGKKMRVKSVHAIKMQKCRRCLRSKSEQSASGTEAIRRRHRCRRNRQTFAYILRYCNRVDCFVRFGTYSTFSCSIFLRLVSIHVRCIRAARRTLVELLCARYECPCLWRIYWNTSTQQPANIFIE